MNPFQDDVRWGILIGILSPIFTLITYYYIHFAPVDFFFLYFQLLLTDHQFLKEISAGFIILSALSLVLCINAGKMRIAFGIFTSTLILGLLCFGINVIFSQA